MPPAPSLPRVAFLTLGCPKNEVDSDRMRAAVLSSGMPVVDELEAADIVVVNTCSFIQDAAEESIEAVLELAHAWVPEARERRLVVAGCLASRYGAELAAALPEADAFVPVAEEDALVEVLAELTGTGAAADARAPGRTVGAPSAYLQVADGCHRTCAFCTIPSIRGPYRSRTLAALEEEARLLVDGGAREITLIGQDISAWGRDLGGDAKLPHVVRSLSAIDGLDWLRLMYVQPEGVTDELLAAMAESPHVCRYLDMPLQHASESVLRRMRRVGSAEAFLSLIAKVRDVLPDVVLRTTLIAGFPGETRADALLLRDFCAEARFDYTGVFAFSPEEGTAAAEMPDQVPTRTRRARAQRLRDQADGIGAEKAAERVGSVLDVLVEGYDEEDGVTVGRWCGQAPEVDGVVLLDGGVVGSIARVRIVDSFGYDLEGELLT